MQHIQILRNCRLPVVVKDRLVIKDCVRGEKVFVEAVHKVDIDDRLYRACKVQILNVSGEITISSLSCIPSTTYLEHM